MCYLQRLKAFILEKEGDEHLFQEETENFVLSLRSQNIIFKYIVDYIQKEHTIYAKHEIVENVCKAAVELFSSLKTPQSEIGSIVSDF